MSWIAKKLARDERGASIIEMGLAAPVLATMLIGMIDLSNAYSAKLQLEQAAQRAIEKVQQYQTTSSTFATLKAEAAAAAGVTVLAVDVEYWLECNGVSQMTSKATMLVDYEKVCPSGQTYTRYIKVAIDKKFTPMFGTKFFPGANADGTFTLTGEAALRTQ